MAGLGKRLLPLFDRVLIERFIPEVKTKGGIMIPEAAAGKVNSGTVVAVGPGGRTDDGKVVPTAVKEGDKVLLPEYGGHKIEFNSKEYYLFRENEILGKWSE